MSQSEVDDIVRVGKMKEELGGQEATEKLSEGFIKKAVYNRKHMDKGYSVFDGGMDFLDSCTKVNAIKAIALLKMGAEPDTTTPEDEPVLVMILRKVSSSSMRRRIFVYAFYILFYCFKKYCLL
jgi:hypothetical protein